MEAARPPAGDWSAEGNHCCIPLHTAATCIEASLSCERKLPCCCTLLRSGVKKKHQDFPNVTATRHSAPKQVLSVQKVLPQMLVARIAGDWLSRCGMCKEKGRIKAHSHTVGAKLEG